MSGRRSLVAIVLLGGAAFLNTGCQPRVVTATDCSGFADPFSSVKPGDRFPVELVYLDLHDNSAGTALRIAEEIRPMLLDALTTGAYVDVVADGGAGTTLQQSACLDGTAAPAPFLVRSGSADHDADDRKTYATALEQQVSAFVESVPIGRRGSPTRLLAQTGRLVDAARVTGRVSSASVVLDSDLLGDDPGDCLGVTGDPGNEATAQAVVAQCISSGQLAPFGGPSLQVVGVADDATTTAQTLLADSLETDLVLALAPDTKEGDPTS